MTLFSGSDWFSGGRILHTHPKASSSGELLPCEEVLVEIKATSIPPLRVRQFCLTLFGRWDMVGWLTWARHPSPNFWATEANRSHWSGFCLAETARRWFGIGSLKTRFSKMTFGCVRRRIQDTVLNTGVFHACGLSCSDTGLHASFGWTWKVSTTGWPVGHGCVQAAKSRKIYAKKM